MRKGGRNPRFSQQTLSLKEDSVTGGNPLLYPHFMDLYRTAANLGFALAILGNPAPRKKIERIMAFESPVFYQVSLEGLKRHNDEMRG